MSLGLSRDSLRIAALAVSRELGSLRGLALLLGVGGMQLCLLLGFLYLRGESGIADSRLLCLLRMLLSGRCGGLFGLCFCGLVQF